MYARSVNKKKPNSFQAFSRTLLSLIFSFINQKFTVKIIPHSEKQVVNFQVNILFLFFICALLILLLVSFFYMTTVYSGSGVVLDEQQEDLIITQGNLNSIIDEVSTLSKVYDDFEKAVSDAFQTLDISTKGEETVQGSGDLSYINNLHEINSGEAREIYDIRRLKESLERAIQPLNDISLVLNAERQILADLPTLWPVYSGHSAITMEFGPNIHPIEGRWYLHKGIDIAGSPGLPILAAANGRVIESSYDRSSGYGNYVLIEHKYGFKTRYSHMGVRSAQVGDIIAQGDRIGTLGNTGISSGAHLDFQIMLGTEVLDPASFLSIKNTFTRWTGNR